MKRNKFWLAGMLAAAVTFGAADASAERIKIQWWHAMSGGLGEGVDEIVRRFNESQDKYEVVATWKGRYRHLLTQTIAAIRAGEQPHFFQNNETGVITLMLSGAIVPAEDMLAKHGVTLNKSDYLSPVTGTYTDPNGKLLGMPFNSSTPILYVNKDLFDAAGLTEMPKTYQDMEAQIRQLQASGAEVPRGGKPCGYGFYAGMWGDLENPMAQQKQFYASKNNGLDGLSARLVYDKPDGWAIMHMKRIKRWLDEGLAEFGAESQTDWSSGALKNFKAGNCLFHIRSTASHATMEDNPFNWTAAHLPYEAGTTPVNTTIGGAALYVLKGFSDEEYAGVVEFFKSLTSVEIQKYWHKKTGYVPITKQAYNELKAEGYYEEFPTKELAVIQLLRGGDNPHPAARVPRLGNFENVRIALEGELRKVWANEQTVEQAFANAVRRGDEILRRFEKQNSRQAEELYPMLVE
ncbi:extracellular solute-binding protein [Nisaea acidiphila]|uniref:sn-glycerol-3-phosphate-binding periplasmic protein UgpB n=1 Tax=Nisaea acidiphila TaxID=1862145 RepID=A0A9J7ANQ1_9PROT|nr:extracellular solute-binding protein [Nisaea acidiphila]UUX48790.1 extracellular solute-binding protein [Nisaea acidiphila]